MNVISAKCVVGKGRYIVSQCILGTSNPHVPAAVMPCR